MSSAVSDSVLEKKFQEATNTQDSIQTLSLWLLHHKVHHQKIVSAWMKVLQKAKINHRLTLFHLANDVVQNSKRRGFSLFVNSFAEVLKEATLLVRDEHIRRAVLRVFNIWEQRNVYTPEFIADLRAILANSKVPATAPSKLLVDFKPEVVIKKIRGVSSSQADVNKRMSAINLTKLNATNAEIVQNLKDRVHGQQFKRDFDKNVGLLEELVEAMAKDITAQSELILLLEQSEIYYDTQRGEAKVVANAYKNFDNRVKTLQKKLTELATTFPSPLPSPSVDAPSPTTSDHELELSLPTENISTAGKDLDHLDDAPSPVGSPEGLNLSPEPKDAESDLQPANIKSVGNPIPTLSNFFGHEQSGMSSWLDAFAAKKDKTDILPIITEPKQSDSGSLDSRLSNLLQNIPNLPSGLQSTLFGGATSSGNNTPSHDTTESPITTKKDKPNDSLNSGALTPVKDEYSGQNTPLQDEDMHSSHSYFSKLASSNKTQSPKDILKGLTNLIQSANVDKEDSQRKEKFSPFLSSELYDQPGSMSTFIKSIIPSISQPSQHLGSPSYFTTSQSTLSESVSTLTTTGNSYQTTAFNNSIPTYSTQSNVGEQQLSFIPSLVPSTPLDNFTFPNESFAADEYNPELETYDTDMDLENPLGEDDSIEVPSPEMEPLSPVRAVSVENDVPRVTIPARRLSTLITLVTDETSSQGLQSDKGGQENGTQESMPIWPATTPVDSSNSLLPTEPMKESPNEEFFIGKPPETNVPSYFSAPPPPPPLAPPNGESMGYMEPIPTTTDNSLSRIETVQSQRENVDNRWFDNSWHTSNMQNLAPPSPDRQFPVRCGPPDPNYFNQNNRNFPRPNLHPHQNWSPRFRPNRPEMFHQKRRHGSFGPRPGPYGPPPNKRFAFRGRGRGWNQPQY